MAGPERFEGSEMENSMPCEEQEDEEGGGEFRRCDGEIPSTVLSIEAEPPKSATLKTISESTNSSSLKRSASDGFNWRKYGQKQVKSPRGSRSYYKCTYSECFAKKIECCDQSGNLTEIVYKIQHNHDPPWKCKLPLSANPVVGNIEHIKRVESESENHSIRYTNGDGEIAVKEEDFNEPDPKQRVKKSNIERAGSMFKTGKKHNIVVHASRDVGISGDGFRWRKYGQKMVKGNPQPRNYYRCTSAGCPVRKHIEAAVDNSSAVTITYKGVHDHAVPVPKKRHGRPSASLVAASAPTSLNNTQLSSPQLGLNGEALELGGEKAMESARTLLSMGFEIKPS